MSTLLDHSTAANLPYGEDSGEIFSDHLSPPVDEATITSLIETEINHMPEGDYLHRCRHRLVNMTARLDAVNWILKVHACYQFRPVTAFLSINYLDRFLSCTSLPRENGWEFQLVSVACFSLAAKMEEPEVPYLMDLQLFEPRFVIQPKMIQRMELWVMANLNWSLHSVTPFDYLHYFITNLPSSSSSKTETQLMNRLFFTASDLIISTVRVIDFLGFAPSTIAAAAVLCSTAIVLGQAPLPHSFHRRLNNEMVKCCQQLMEEHIVDTCPHKEDRVEVASPVGVLDAPSCSSCDMSSDRNNNV
ncbi:putative cyclin [Lupinus albus]|uniref:B-like cyclin n=1 Tax=Lupinus albus TaxID=3870 RepID=A0A6A4QCY8_LUPAL|nr:putative cyclin [Lupinus albus]